VEHLFVKFDDPSCFTFWDIVQINRQTNSGKNTTPPATAVGVGN